MSPRRNPISGPIRTQRKSPHRSRLAPNAEALERRDLMTTYGVGVGMPYAHFANLPTLAAGDVVDVASGVYNESVTFRADGTTDDPITIRGVGSTRPILDGTGVNVDGSGPNPRALFQIQGSNYIIDNLEFRNAHNYSYNGAGIRVLGAANTTIQNCRIDQNDDGIMSSGDDNLLIQYSEIDHNGVDAYDHNVYLEDNRTTIQYSYIHDANYGQNVKTRSHYTALLYNTIADSADGEVGLADAPETASINSNALILGNVIISKPRASDQNQLKFIDFGEDEGHVHDGTLTLANNTLIAGSPTIQFLWATAAEGRIVADNNIFYGSSNIVGINTGPISGSDNWVQGNAADPAAFVNTSRGADPGFRDLADRDFHLVAGSPVLNLGLDNLTAVDGSGTVIPAVPRYEYASPTGRTTRTRDRQPDLGAFEGQATPGIVISDASVVKGDAGTVNMNFTLETTALSSSDASVTVKYATSDGTAVAGTDYVETSGTLTIAPGQKSVTIAVPIDGGTQWTGNRTFSVILSSPSGTSLARAVATGTIIDGNRPTRFDFGTPNSPDATGYAPVNSSTAYTAGRGFGWLTGKVGDTDRGPVAGTSELTRSLEQTTDATFAVDLPDGTYAVTLTTGDASYAHLGTKVYLQGVLTDTVSTSAGKFETLTYPVAVSGGQLTLRLTNRIFAVINALQIQPIHLDADVAAPHLVSASPTGDVYLGDSIINLTGAPLDHAPDGTSSIGHVDFTFSEPIDPYSFTTATVSMGGPSGPIAPYAIRVVDATHFTVLFPEQTQAGHYSITIGQGVLDMAGNPLSRTTIAFTLKAAATIPVVRSYDFGTASSPVVVGYTHVSSASKYAPAAGFGWLSGKVGETDRGAIAGASDLTRYLNQTADATFAVDLPNGTYDVALTMGDALYAHLGTKVYFQGTLANTVSTSGGHFTTQTYRLVVSGGRLTLRLTNPIFAVINALQIRRVSP